MSLSQSTSGLAAYTLANASTSTYYSSTIASSLTGGLTVGRYYRGFVHVKGNFANPLYTSNYGYYAGGTPTFSCSSGTISNSTILTKMQTSTYVGSNVVNWLVAWYEYANLTDYNNGVHTQSIASTEYAISFGSALQSVLSYSINNGNTFNLDTSTSFPVAYSEPSSHTGWRSRITFYINNVSFATASGNTAAFTATLTAAQIQTISNTMGNTSPGTLKVKYELGWSCTGGATSFYFTSAYREYDVPITKEVVTVNPVNVGTTYAFPSPWANSYYYLYIASSVPSSTGTYALTIETWLYNHQAINATISGLTCTVDGVSATKTMNLSSINVAYANTQKLESFNITVGPFTSLSPTVTLVSGLTLSGIGTLSGQTAVTAAGRLPSIPALTVDNIILSSVTNGAIGSPSTIYTQDTSMEISNNDNDFYKVLTYEPSTGTIGTSAAFGSSTLSGTWGTRSPYTLYTYTFSILGRDGSTYGTTNVDLRSNDAPPLINTFTSSSKTTTTVSVAATCTALSSLTLTYDYYQKKTTAPADADFSLAASSASSTYTYTGLSQYTTYDFKVVVTNGDGYIVSTGDVGQASNLTVTTYSTVPVITSYDVTPADTSMYLKIYETHGAGLTTTYSFGIYTGGAFVWTAYQAGDDYTYAGLTSGISYNFRLRVKDNTNNVTESSTITSSTLYTKPVITNVTATGITTNTLTLRVSTENNQRTSINKWKFKVYKDGSAVPGSWTEKTSDVYFVTGLDSGSLYHVLVVVDDNQTPILSSDQFTTTATTATASVTALTKTARFIRATSSTMPSLIKDGTFIITTDNGNIYLDEGTERKLISYGMKVYEVDRDGSDVYTITTNDFDNINLATDRTISFYFRPVRTSIGSTPQIKIVGTIVNLQTALYTTAFTQMAVTANALYLVTYNDNNSPVFMLVNY